MITLMAALGVGAVAFWMGMCLGHAIAAEGLRVDADLCEQHAEDRYWEGFGAGIDMAMGDTLEAYATGFGDGEGVTRNALAAQLPPGDTDALIDEGYRAAKAQFLESGACLAAGS
jgi:hypothetical protein